MPAGCLRATCALSIAALLMACAAEIPVKPATVVPLVAAVPDLVVASDLPISLSTGYSRTVPRGSRWRAVGSLPQGIVYQPVGTVFAIEGRQVHEAYLVLRGDSLQGFFLPGEGNFSSLAHPISLPLATGAQR